jgi:hypothetical protein
MDKVMNALLIGYILIIVGITIACHNLGYWQNELANTQRFYMIESGDIHELMPNLEWYEVSSEESKAELIVDNLILMSFVLVAVILCWFYYPKVINDGK